MVMLRDDQGDCYFIRTYGVDTEIDNSLLAVVLV